MELEPLRRIGYALDQATLQQVAYNHGIQISITNMTQAQKAQIRYIAIMEQSKNAMGDLARTIDSPSNQLRILEGRIETLKRAIGDSLLPVLSAALPYVTAFVQILGEFLRSVAEFMGFELPVFDYSDVIKSGNDNISDSFDDATAAANKFKGTLSSIDQLNIIGSKSETAAKGNQFGTDLDLDLPSYDFLGDLEAETSQAYRTLKEFLGNIAPVAKGIATALATAFAIKGVAGFVDNIKTIVGALKNLTPLGKLATGIAAGVGAFVAFRNVIKDLTTGNGSFTKLGIAIGATVAAVTAFIALKNPLGAVLTVVGAGLGIVSGYVNGIKQQAEDRAIEKITAAFEEGITPISEVADALERVSTELTSSEQDYLNRKESLGFISDNAKNVGDNISTMISELKGMEEISPDVTENLKKAFEDLATASKKYIEESNNNFKLYILANQDMLKAQGFNVSSMVELINEGTKNATQSIEDLQARAKELSDRRLSVGLSSDELTELENINMQLLQMSGVDVDFGVDIKGTTDVLENLASIKFTDAKDAADNMERAFSVIADAYSTLKTAKEEMLSQLDEIALMNGWTDETKLEFQRAIEFTFEVKENALDEAFSGPVNSIIAQAKSLGSKIAMEIAQATAEGVEGAFNTPLGILFNSDYRANLGGKSFEDINKEKYNEIVGGAASYLENPLEKLYSAFAEKGLSQDVVDKMRKNGKNIDQGLADGIKENAPIVKDSIKDIADSLNKIWKIETETNSPSRLYKKFGGYLMDGLEIGILSGKPRVLSALDDVIKAINQKMGGISVEIPVYTSEDVESAMNPTIRNPILARATTAQQPEYQGADPEMVGRTAQAWNSSGKPLDINVNVQSYLELEGDQIGEATTRYQRRQMAYSNGY